MSKRLKGAQAIIKEMGADIPEEERERNIQEAEVKRTASSTKNKKEGDAKAIEGDRKRNKLTTTVAVGTSELIAKIQVSYLEMGYKKPSAGKLIDEAIAEFAERREIN